jgi:hypothetical protein
MASASIVLAPSEVHNESRRHDYDDGRVGIWFGTFNAQCCLIGEPSQITAALERLLDLVSPPPAPVLSTPPNPFPDATGIQAVVRSEPLTAWSAEMTEALR